MKFFITMLPIFFLLHSIQVGAQTLNDLDSASYFDFWIGEWDVAWDEGEGVEVLGTNTINKTLDNKVIQEQFRITAGKNKGFKGTSISVFNPRSKLWKQAWADNQGGYFDFNGDFEGERRVFQTSERSVRTSSGDSVSVTQRMIFYNIKKDQMTWDWEMTKDGGDTWQLQWRIFYTRKGN